MSYLVLKTIHLISVIAWFAGLFYVGRLFIYFNEAKSYEKVKKKIKSEVEKMPSKQFETKDFFKYNVDDFKLVNYQHHEKIDAMMNV